MGIAGVVFASFSAYSSIQQPVLQRSPQNGECVSSSHAPQKIDKDCIEEIIRRGQCIERETRDEEKEYVEVSRTTLYGPKGETYKTIKRGLEKLDDDTQTFYVTIEGRFEEDCLREVKEEGYCLKETSTWQLESFKRTTTTIWYGSNEK